MLEIAEDWGVFDFDGFSLEARCEKNDLAEILVRGEKSVRLEISLPFVVRRCEIGDAVLNAEGLEKSVSDVFSAWKVPECERGKIPILECGFPLKISAVLGCVLGYENWIVAQNSLADF